MELNECECSMKCLAKLELWLLVLNAFLCSLNLAKKLLPFCPTYVLLQSGHVSLYTPDRVYLSGAYCLCVSSDWMVFVRSVILRSVFLNRFVMKVVSLLM
jgi:hypothetical protein